jgi:hypothetical protein
VGSAAENPDFQCAVQRQCVISDIVKLCGEGLVFPLGWSSFFG